MTVLFLTNDLLFSSRVTSMADQFRVPMIVVTEPEDLLSRVRTPEVKLVLLDLGTCRSDLATLVPQLRSAAGAPLSVMAFGPHVDEATLSAARKAGCDHVYTRGQFSGQMRKILTPYMD